MGDHFSLSSCFLPLISLNSPLRTMLLMACSTKLSLYLSCISDSSLLVRTWLPMQTRFLIASSIFWMSSENCSGTTQPNSLPSMLLSVESSKRQCAQSTSQVLTSSLSLILARASLSLMTASSCRTVMGMELRVCVSSLCSLAFWRSATQMPCSFSQALEESLGLILLLAYLIYFLSKSKGKSTASSALWMRPWWRSRMCEATRMLFQGVLMSRTTKMQSNLERMVVCSQICQDICFRSSYLPKMGLAAASTEQREFSRVVMPALATLMVCCSIASWMATRSAGFILSNQSMHTIPPSASTKAPPSIWNYPVELSLLMLAVRPAADDPFPDVYTPIDAVCSTNFRNCDFAVDGSPISRMFMSPRSRVWSGRCFLEPPKSMQAIARLTSQLPNMPGAIDRQIFQQILGSLLIVLKISSSCSVYWKLLLSLIFSIPVTQRQPLDKLSCLSSCTIITPVILTRSPGTHLLTFQRSATRPQVRAIQPVGTSQGFYWILRDWVSMTQESGVATQGSLGHFSFTPACPGQKLGTYGNWPGASSIVLLAMQLRHFSLSLLALMQGLVVLIMMPLMTNSLETMALVMLLIFLGIQSLRRATCQSASLAVGNSSFFSRKYRRTPSSMTLSISCGLVMNFSQSCSSQALRSLSSKWSTFLFFWIWRERWRWQTRTFSRLQSWRKDLKVCWKWVLVPQTRAACSELRFWSEKQTRYPCIYYSLPPALPALILRFKLVRLQMRYCNLALRFSTAIQHCDLALQQPTPSGNSKRQLQEVTRYRQDVNYESQIIHFYGQDCQVHVCGTACEVSRPTLQSGCRVISGPLAGPNQRQLLICTQLFRFSSFSVSQLARDSSAR